MRCIERLGSNDRKDAKIDESRKIGAGSIREAKPGPRIDHCLFIESGKLGFRKMLQKNMFLKTVTKVSAEVLIS